jgi:hypothetical protein
VTKSVRLAALLLGLVVGECALAQSDPGSSAAVVAEVNGSVLIQVGNAAPRLLLAGQGIPSGATFLTGADANVVLRFADGQIAVIGERTTFRVADYRFDPKDMSRSRDVLNVVAGSVRIIVGAIGQSDPWLVHLHVGKGTIFPVVYQNGSKPAAAGVTVEGMDTIVTVTQGQAYLSLANGNGILLASGGGIYVQPSGNYQQGGAEQIYTQLGETSYGRQLARWLQTMQSFEISQRSPRMVITLAAPFPFEIPAFPPPATGTPVTAETGAGAGGTPCGASCN